LEAYIIMHIVFAGLKNVEVITWEQTTYMAKLNIFYILWILLSFQLKCCSNIDSIHYLGLTNSFDQVPRDIHTHSSRSFKQSPSWSFRTYKCTPIWSCCIYKYSPGNPEESARNPAGPIWHCRTCKQPPRPGTGEYWKMQMVRAPKENPWLSAECWLTLYTLSIIL
jgi:hypothetical protein